jgi:hypothetical protein
MYWTECSTAEHPFDDVGLKMAIGYSIRAVLALTHVAL